MRPSRHVFVTGGTGYIGRRVILALLSRGHRVRALAREGSEGKLPAGCEAVLGNALEQMIAALVRAVENPATGIRIVESPEICRAILSE